MAFHVLAHQRLLAVASTVLLAALAISAFRPSRADDPPTIDPVLAYTDQVTHLIQDHKLDELAKLALPAVPEGENRLTEWKDQFVAELLKSEQVRDKQFNEYAAKAQDFLARGKFPEAIDRTVAAYLIAKDRDAFLNLEWVKQLTTKTAAQAAECEKQGQWLESLQYYTSLNDLYDVDTRYKADMQRLARRTRLLALYTPKTLYDMRKAMTARLESEKAATQPSGPTAELEPLTEPTFTRWQDQVEGINTDMSRLAVDLARRQWVEGTTYEPLLRGGVEALRLFLTTPELATEFPGLKDKEAKDQFDAALNTALAAIKAEPSITTSQMHRILNELSDANASSVKLPDTVLLMEFTDGAMEKLDPFTAVIWPHQMDEFEKSTRGTFGGVGIQISLENGVLKVITPLEDTPAFLAGIEADDIVTAIDGKATAGISIDQAVHTIMGPPGSQVVLTVKRAGRAEPLTFNLTRAEIHVASIKGYKRDPGDLSKWLYMLDPQSKIGYIRVTGFQEDTVKELTAAINSLQAQDVKGIILDLRFNPGGLLRAAIEMSNLFLDHGVIVSTGRPTSVSRNEARAEPRNILVPNSMPIMVLVNQYSASASEIFSGAMKDLGRATVVGQRSFGKGSVQNVEPISDKPAASIKLTVNYYYLPNGESLHRRDGAKTWGVEPNVAVDMTPAQIGALIKDRRDREIIAAHAATNPDVPATAPATQPGATTKAAEPLLDTQLDTALFLLRLQLLQNHKV